MKKLFAIILLAAGCVTARPPRPLTVEEVEAIAHKAAQEEIRSRCREHCPYEPGML